MIHRKCRQRTSGINMSYTNNILISLPNCLQKLSSSALSSTKLESTHDNNEENTMNLFDTSKSSIGASEDGPQGLEVIQNISVKDGCVIGFMLALWLYSMILMFRYFVEVSC